MRAVALLVGILCLAGIASANDPDGAFGSIVDRLANSEPCPVSLVAVAKDTPAGAVLTFTLKNTTPRKLTFFKPFLPWTTADSIRVAALTRSGDLVRGFFPIDDYFGTERISLNPGETLSGDYALNNRWEVQASTPSGLPRNSKLLIVWSWDFRPEENDSSARRVCSGVTALATQGHGPNTSLERTRER